MSAEARQHALRVIREQIAEAVAAKKCHTCGCLHKTVEALSATEAGMALEQDFRSARAVFKATKYDCLGCAVCFPAIAANAFEEAFPSSATTLDLCPSDAPTEQPGWPPLPGDYRVARHRASVGVCVLNTWPLAERLVARAPDGLSIAGALRTENLGIERLVRNVLANPYIRFLIVCGEDARQAVGHLPGQSLESLFTSGVDESGRIRGAKGKRPVLRNLDRSQITRFVRQVELVSMIGVVDEVRVLEMIEACSSRNVGPLAEDPVLAGSPTEIAAIDAQEPARLIPDPQGFFVVYPDTRSRKLVVEHYLNAGLLNLVIEGRTPSAIYSEIVARSLIGRLDHAAYLGRELARAEHSLKTGEPYVQDRAAGEIDAVVCGGACSNAQGAKS